MVDNRYLCPLYNPDFDNSSETSFTLNVIVALLNGVFLLIVSISNLLVVYVIFDRPSLRTSASHVLLASQASANVAVSLVAQPSLIALQIEDILGNANGYCTAQLLNVAAFIICILASFWSVLGMSVNQYLALAFSTWYTTTINSRNVMAMVIFAWSVTTLTCALCVALGITRLFLFIAIIVAVFFTFLALVFSVKSYLKIRQYLMQVQQQLEVPTDTQREVNTPNISRHQKTVTMVFCILATGFITHVPLFSTVVTAYFVGWTESTKTAFVITFTVAYCSSSLISAIYFRWNDEIRHAVFHVLGY